MLAPMLDTTTTTLLAARQRAVRALLEAGWEMGEAQREARMMLTIATGHAMETQVGHPDWHLTDTEDARFEQLLQRRLRREPMAYLAGSREFYGRDFEVAPATLIPRPDSETLIEAVLADLPENAAARLLDLGTGTGCLLLTLLAERPNATGLGTDLRPEAVALAGRNAETLGLFERAGFRQGSWWEALGDLPQTSAMPVSFDAILSNPPYIPTADIASLMADVVDYEPSSALDGGADGLDAYRLLLDGAADYLSPTGRIYFEIGQGQGAEITALAAARGFVLLHSYRDLGGIERVLVFQSNA